jgi:hypothetical protein
VYFCEKEMNMQDLPFLSVGQQDFAQIRKAGMIYVDKTHFLHGIIKSRAPFWFLARPRRFGKSLLINTLKEIFLGKKELFSGLYIEDKIIWEEYPVIHLDFSKIGFQTLGLEKAIHRCLNIIAEEYEIVYEETEINTKFEELMKALDAKTGKQVVILIDEYDKPITDVLEVGENAEARKNRKTMRDFYSVVKGSSEFIRLFFVTGIARFSQVSIFSDLNNLTDLSGNKDYHNLLGYTQEELTQYFSPHLNFIAEEKNISLDELLAQVKEWYNGFSWNGKDRVYNPYSILLFLTEREFKNFWFASGTPKFLIELLKKEEVYDISGIEVDIAETENIDIDNLGLVTLFFQTGYLTVKEKSDDDMYTLVYPNKEVAESMQKQILANYSGKLSNVSVAKNMAKAVKNNDFLMLESSINTLFASIPHQIFDASQEKYFHAILFLAFKLCGYHIHCEVSTSQGRADAVMFFDKCIYIFEFKLNESAKVAVQQIHDRGYYKQFLGQNKEIYLIGINFSGATKSVEELLAQKL